MGKRSRTKHWPAMRSPSLGLFIFLRFLYAVVMEKSDWSALRFFDDFGAIRMTGDKLPHWQQNNCACFVTFRLGDSIPADVLAHWKKQRANWIEMHPEPWSLATEQEYHMRFSRFIDRELDACHGRCLLRNPELSALVARSLLHFDRQRYLLHCHVVMPNHVHVLLSPHPDFAPGAVVSSWKRWTASRIGRQMGENGGIWQQDYFDRLIRDWDHFQNVARYIRNNPRKAGLGSGEFRLYLTPWIERLLG